MSIIEIGWHFANGWSLLRSIRALDSLGYTRQERRSIVRGWQYAQHGVLRTAGKCRECGKHIEPAKFYCSQHGG